MAKLRKEYNPDRAGRRNRRPVIYIICEGKETEINYFRHFRTRRFLVDVVPISSKHTAAEHLVKHEEGIDFPCRLLSKRRGSDVVCV